MYSHDLRWRIIYQRIAMNLFRTAQCSTEFSNASEICSTSHTRLPQHAYRWQGSVTCTYGEYPSHTLTSKYMYAQYLTHTLTSTCMPMPGLVGSHSFLLPSNSCVLYFPVQVIGCQEQYMYTAPYTYTCICIHYDIYMYTVLTLYTL